MTTDPPTRRDFLKQSFLASLLLFTPSGCTLFNADKKIFTSAMHSFTDAGLEDQPIGDILVTVGKHFLNTPYVEGNLDKDNASEDLITPLTGFDCVTFVESCLAFARCIQTAQASFDAYRQEIEHIRYRDGSRDGYASRLHYFSDWITKNQEKDIVTDLTKRVGGVRYHKEINFMSTHRDVYEQLSDADNLEAILATEADLTAQKMYYIPKNKISALSKNLRDGDIIGTTTTIAGLDTTHTGYIAKGKNGIPYFLHASSHAKKVILSSKPLDAYIAADAQKTGIVLVRPQESAA